LARHNNEGEILGQVNSAGKSFGAAVNEKKMIQGFDCAVKCHQFKRHIATGKPSPTGMDKEFPPDGDQYGIKRYFSFRSSRIRRLFSRMTQPARKITEQGEMRTDRPRSLRVV